MRLYRVLDEVLPVLDGELIFCPSNLTCSFFNGIFILDEEDEDLLTVKILLLITPYIAAADLRKMLVLSVQKLSTFLLGAS